MTATLAGRRRASKPTLPLNATSLVVAVDHAHARFFLVQQRQTVELPCLVSPRMRGGRFHSDRQGSPGWGEGGFHGRRREEERRHMAAVARRIAAELRSHDVHELVLGGSTPVVAALRRALPATVAELVAGTTPLNPVELTAARVAQVTPALQRSHTRLMQAEWLARLQEAFGRRLAAEGLRDVLRALGEGQVRTLLVAAGFGRAGYRCARSGRLVLTKTDAEAEPVVRIGDVVAAAKDDTRALGGEVIEIEDPQLAARLDGVAALLRHR
jgi:peptide subunit release factor 1 (eRF1)